MSSDSKAPVTDEQTEELSKIINSFIDVPATEPTRFNEFFQSLEILLASRALAEAKEISARYHRKGYREPGILTERIAELEQAAASKTAGGGDGKT